jgi:hypothetical protein
LTDASAEDIRQYRKRYNQWKARCIAMCCISRMDSEYRHEVKAKGGNLGTASSNAFLALYSKDGQLIYKATAFDDGVLLGNGIARLIFSYLPIVLEEVDAMEYESSDEEDSDDEDDDEDEDDEEDEDEDDEEEDEEEDAEDE